MKALKIVLFSHFSKIMKKELIQRTCEIQKPDTSTQRYVIHD